MKLSTKFEKALQWAAEIHRVDVRKGTDIPYVSHPLAVVSIVLEHGGSEDEAIGALLHDAVEDHPNEVTFREVRQRFGAAVAAIVEGCSDSSTHPKPPYRERKAAYIAHLATASASVRLVSLADKVHNARSILRDHQRHSDKVWTRFTAGKDGTLWYYRELVGAFRGGSRGLRPDPLAALIDELDGLVCTLERRARGGGHSGRFFYAEPLGHPEDVRPYLARLSHWKDGYSAAAIARSWIGTGDIPAAVRAVLATDDVYRDAELVEGLLEHQTRLRTPGRASQTDLLAIVAIREGYAVLAVEGKCNESFAEKVTDWLKGKTRKSPSTEPPPDGKAGDSRTRRRRLEELCGVLGLDAAKVGDLRYQLFHRTVAAVYEAKRYRCRHAAVIVHSFTGQAYVGFKDVAAFAKALAVPITKERPVSAARVLDGVAITLAWVRDDLTGQTGPADDSVRLLERLRARGVLDGNDWRSVTKWMSEAREYLAGADRTVSKGADGSLVLDLDADPRNAEWLRIVRVRRLTRQEIPDWAALWLWRLGHDRGPRFWSKVSEVARLETRYVGSEARS